VRGKPYVVEMENLKGWEVGDGVTFEIPSMLGVWIFFGNTHCSKSELYSNLQGRLWFLHVCGCCF